MLFRMKEIRLLTNEVLTELIFINKNLGVRYWGKNLGDQRTGVVAGCSLPVSFPHRKGSTPPPHFWSPPPGHWGQKRVPPLSSFYD